MKCHYEVLGVARDANNDDLKKAYRKLALKWHPDKNPDNLDESTVQFRLVQQAYEVLNDPQERAFYDKHREAILRGGMGQGDQYEDKSMDVFQFFNSSCYKGFGDDKEGFYAVYDEVFKVIAEEDRQFMEEDEYIVYDFGNSQTIYEEVVKPFYDYWEHYCTAKSYVWVEKYDLREAPDRRVRRMMEAENKKLRDAAKKERNEEVRALAKYVKKRDKRVQAYKKKLEERAEEIAQKAKEQRQRHLEEGRKKLENYQEAEWSSASGLEDHYKLLEAAYDHQFGGSEQQDTGDGDEKDVEEVEEEEEIDDLFCVACNKAFKSDKAFINHEKSKKHKEMVAIIKAHMEEEEAAMSGVTGQTRGSCDPGEVGDEGEEEDYSQANQKLSKKQKKKRRQQKNVIADEVEDVTESLENTSIADQTNGFPQKTKSKKERRREKKNQDLEDSDDQLELEASNIPKSTEETITKTDNSCHDSDSKGDNSDSPSCNRLGEDVSTGKDKTDTAQHSNNVPHIDEDQESVGSQQSDNSKKKAKKTGPDPNQTPGVCGVCGAEFPSRSKLFDHIKTSGHALLKEVPKGQQGGQKQGKKNKKQKGK